MNIHPIKTENDYESALAEAERLWGVAEGTEKGDVLDVILVLIEDYENKHRNGPRNLYSPLSEIFSGFQATNS